MADRITPERRSWNMSRIRGKDTGPEIKLRSHLHRSGLRYRVHSRKLPGKPDIAFISAKVAVFVDGCFWHRCPEHYTRPATNTAFWDEKITRNVVRDGKNTETLEAEGWTVLRFWEHEIDDNISNVVNEILHTLGRATIL